MLTYYTGGNVAQTRAAKASALRDIERQNDQKIRDAIKELRGIKVRALRDEKRKRIREMREEHKRMIAQVRERFDAKIAELRAEAEKMAGELKSSKLSRKHTKDRNKGRVTGSEKRQELDDQVENDVRHWRPELVPLWRKVRVGFPNRPGMSRFEAFQHYVHETPDAVAVLQEQQDLINELEMECDQAREFVGRTNDKETQSWIVDNCGTDATKLKKKPKGSAASRTPSLFASGERPTEEKKKAKEKEKGPKKGPKAAPGQQGLTVGKMKASSFVDSLDQIPF